METLTQITNYLASQSWQIALLSVAVAAVSLLLKNRSSHVRYLLWLVVLAKCLVPPLLTITLAVLPQKEVAEPVVTTPVEMPVVEVKAVEVMQGELVTLPAVPVVTQPLAKPSIVERLAEISARQWLVFAWVVGAIVFVLAALIKALRVNRWLRRERKALPDGLQVAVDNLFGDLGIRTGPKVWLVEGIGQPFVWGLVRGGIYLPANFVGVEGNENRRGVLGHELGHVLRFDAAVNLLQIIAQAIFWFHPFVWWANRKIRAEREKCCDEMAIARLGARAKDYSRAIVNTLIAEHEAALPIPSLAVAGPVKNIEDRIKTIMRPGKRFYRRPSLITAITVLLLALIAVPTTLALTRRAAAISDKQARKDSESAESDSNTPAGGYWWSYGGARPSSGKLRKRSYIRDHSPGARYGYGRGGPSVPPGASEVPKAITCSGGLYNARGQPLAQAVVTLYAMEIEHETNNRTVLRREETKTMAGGKYSFTTKVPTPRDGTYPMGLIVAEKEGMELEWGNWDLQDNIEIDFMVREKEKFPKAGPVGLSAKEVVERIYASERKIRSLEMQLESRVTRGESSSLDWGYENGKEYVHSLSDRPFVWGKGVPKNRLREKKAFDGEKSYSLLYSDEIDHKSGYINLVKNNRTTLNVLTPLHFLGCQLFWDDRRTLGEVLRDTAEVSVKPEIEIIEGHPCAVIEAVGVGQLILRRRPSGEGFEDAIQKWNVRVWIDLKRDYRPLRIDKYRTDPEDRWWCLGDRHDQINLKRVEGIWLPTEGRSERFYARYILPPKSMDVEQWQQMPYAKRRELSIPIQVATGRVPVPFEPGPEIIRVDEDTIRINKGIGPEKFVVEFPAGTRLQDQVKHITYTVGGFDDPTYEPKTPAEKVLKQLRDREVKVDPKLKGDFIAVLRDFEVFDDSEKWMAAVRALYLIGRPAVPDLVAELERTKNPKTQSAIALTLRAIGDPSAIPALIDALARTEPMSDCGLGEPKYDLHRFMMKHQKDLSDPELNFGRPVREITETLERLTGHSEGHKHFSTYDENGKRLSIFDRSPEVVELRKKIRAEAADRWRQWWQKNKQTFLKQNTDAKVDGKMKMEVEAGFGSVIEQFCRADAPNGDTYIDLESGRAYHLSEDSTRRKAAEVFLERAKESGVDIGVRIREGDVCYIGSVDAFLCRPPGVDLQKITASQVLSNPELQAGELDYGNITKRRDQLPVSLLFKTREGGKGVLEVTGFTDNPKGVRIRCKVVRGAASPGKATWGEAVEGVRCRLRPDRHSWQAGETPTLKADICNRGTHQLSVVQHQSVCELWCDGRWYSWAGEIRAKSSSLGPGRQYNDIPVSLDGHWVSKSNGKPLRLRRRHLVRLAFTGELSEPAPGEVIRVHSNPVLIEILPKGGGGSTFSAVGDAVDEVGARCLVL